jgi:putative tricarboxylic transport membrane protein
MWARLLRVPYALMYPFILLFCLIGAYSVSHNIGDGILMWVFGVAGYLLKKFDYEAAPLILALVIGPLMEEALRQSLILSGGSFDIFVVRPITAAFLLAAGLLLLLPVLRRKPTTA